MKNVVYADCAATTPVSDSVLAAMLPYLKASFGNPSALYGQGREAHDAVSSARRRVASLIGAEPSEIVFTASGSEADNTAIRSAAYADSQKRHIIVSSIEHHAVLNTAAALQKEGFELSYAPCDKDGIVTPDAISALLRPDTALVCVMYANNEIGTVQPVGEIARLAHQNGSLFLTDAVQAVGTVPVDVKSIGCDYLALSGHKFHAPKGIGALYVKTGAPYRTLIWGGGQEAGRRGGTENVPGIVGLGQAAADAKAALDAESFVLANRERIIDALLSLPGARLIGDRERRLPGNVSISFSGLSGEGIVHLLDAEGIAVSTGSACDSVRQVPSHVLTALGLDEETVDGTVRISICRTTTDEEVTTLIDCVTDLVVRLRQMQ